jgi:hypothetical protein
LLYLPGHHTADVDDDDDDDDDDGLAHLLFNAIKMQNIAVGENEHRVLLR